MRPVDTRLPNGCPVAARANCGNHNDRLQGQCRGLRQRGIRRVIPPDGGTATRVGVAAASLGAFEIWRVSRSDGVSLRASVPLQGLTRTRDVGSEHNLDLKVAVSERS